MHEKIINLLKKKNIVLDIGLAFDELVEIENIYGVKFPNSLRNFLMTTLPISKGFYNWRNKEQENVEFIKSVINQPIKYINEMPEEIYWCEEWGEKPEDGEIFNSEVKRRLQSAPKLLPIFQHRYIPVILEEDPPIISVHGGDIIYMGENLEDYIEIEFGGKKQNEINFSKINSIPFWTDIM